MGRVRLKIFRNWWCPKKNIVQHRCLQHRQIFFLAHCISPQIWGLPKSRNWDILGVVVVGLRLAKAERTIRHHADGPQRIEGPGCQEDMAWGLQLQRAVHGESLMRTRGRQVKNIFGFDLAAVQHWFIESDHIFPLATTSASPATTLPRTAQLPLRVPRRHTCSPKYAQYARSRPLTCFCNYDMPTC